MAFLRYLGPQTVAAVLGHALDLALALGVWLGCAAVARPLKLDLLASAVVGQVLVSAALFAAGLLGLYDARLLTVAAVLLAALGYATVERPRPRWSWWWAVAGLGLLRGAVAAGAPVTDWDTLAYHLGLPKLWLLLGRHARFDWSVTAHLPHSSEMLNLLLLAARGGEAAQWLQWVNGAALVAAVGPVGGAVLAVQPPFQRVLGTGKSDLACALAAVLAVQAWRRGDLRAAGLLSGAAASLKLTGLWVLASLGLLTRSRKFVLPALLLGSLWYARNLAWTGNPVWPFFTDPSYARQRASNTGGVEQTPLNFVLSPALTVVRSERFLHAAPWLTAAAPFSVMPWDFAALYWTCWFWVSQDGRYLLPVYSVAAAGLRPWAAPLALVPLKDLRLGNEAFGFFAARPSDGAPPLRRYLERALGAPYLVMSEANRLLPPEARVAVLFDPRGYYLERDHACYLPVDAGPLDWARPLGPQLRALGFTHVLHNPTLGRPKGDAAYYEAAERGADELVRGLPRLAGAGPIGLYRL